MSLATSLASLEEVAFTSAQPDGINSSEEYNELCEGKYVSEKTLLESTERIKHIKNVVLPDHIDGLKGGFYRPLSEDLKTQWCAWLQRWRNALNEAGKLASASIEMQQENPAITWREWLVAPAYQQAEQGNHQLVQELQTVFNAPYTSPSSPLDSRYDQLKPRKFFNAGGVSHYSCSS